MARRWRGGDSVVSLLRLREEEADCCVMERISCKILQKVILQPSTTFIPVWEKSSYKHICIGLDRRIYFENHQQCYYNDGIGGVPRKSYQLPSARNSMKILAALLYHSSIRRTPCSPEEKEVCLLVLTADGFLKVLHAASGAVLSTVFLSSSYVIPFKYLMWADHLQTVQVKSVHQAQLPAARGGGAGGGGAAPPQTHRLLLLAVFCILPLELITCFSVDRNVFGDDIKDASINEDLLVIIHKNGTYRFYSVAWIIDHCSLISAPRLGKVVEGASGRGTLGEPGFGVPVTVKITERPPLLFEAKSGRDCGVSFGGCPTVYIHNGQPANDSIFHIRSLASGRLISELSTDITAFHHDVAEFHFDDYQRVLHISGCTVRCSHLHRCADGEQKLREQFSVDLKKALHGEDTSCQPLRTQSGRTIRRRVRPESEFDDFSSAVQDLDYENEVELLYAVVTLLDLGSLGDTRALLCFLDDRTGRVTKEVPLPTWKPGAANSIYYELDCILHLVTDDGHSTCHYYRLSPTK